MSETRHLTEHQVSASVDGVLHGASQEQVLRHLADCEECRARYEELAHHHRMLAALLAHEADDTFFSALESDVDRALRVSDALPPAAVVSVRSGPSKPTSTSTPRPTLQDALGSIGARPAWAPADALGPATKPAATPPAAATAPAPAAPAPAKIEARGTPARPAGPAPGSAPPPASRTTPEPFVDDMAFDEPDEPVEYAADTPRARRKGGVPVLSYALAAVAVIAVATIAVMLLRRGDSVRPPDPAPATTASVRDDAPDVDETSALPPVTDTGASATTPAPFPAGAAAAAKPNEPPRQAPVTAAAPVPRTRSSADLEAPGARAARQSAAAPSAAPATVSPVTHAPATHARSAPRPAAGPARLCGIVRDANGNVVVRAQVLVAGTSLGAITNAEGRFCLTVPGGSHELSVSALGFAAGTQSVTAAPGMGEVAITLRPADATP